MTNSEKAKLQQEMNEMMTNFRKVKSENTAVDNGPALTKKYEYRKTTIIKVSDLAAL